MINIFKVLQCVDNKCITLLTAMYNIFFFLMYDKAFRLNAVVFPLLSVLFSSYDDPPVRTCS